MRGISGILVVFTLFGALAGTAREAQAQAAADSAGAHAAAVGFLAAFDSVQWEPFRAFFADDVTMFFPFGDTPARADGREAVEARFRRFFDEGIAAWQRSGRTGAPRLGITPRDLRVQMAGSAAIVSFHLGAENPSRRSLVFHYTPAGEWKLVHWHASPAPPRPAPAAAPAASATPPAPATRP
jgi:ketosteroid isomerase-like protein